MSKVAIILLNYNNYEDTLECIKSIKDNCKLDYELIVVDNDSKDECKKILLENSDKYTLILNDENNGFADGNNIGIKYAIEKEIEYILLLNNDTLITYNSIENMLNILETDSSVGAVSCRILYYPDKEKIWYDGGKIDWNKYLPIHINMGEKIYEHTKIDVEENTEFISGCCMFINSKVFKEVGYLPEEYFMYFEDLDFCIQIIEKGYKLKVCNESIIYHKVSSSSGGEESPFSIKWGNRNRIILIEKYKNKVKVRQYIMTYCYFIISRIVKLLSYLCKGEFSKCKALLSGLSNAIKYKIRKGILKCN